MHPGARQKFRALVPRGPWPHVPSEPHPAGVGTALSCSKEACALADKERPKRVLQLEVFGLDARGTSQQ